MTLSSSPSSFDARSATAQAPPPRAARVVLKMLRSLATGSLTVRLPDGRTEAFGRGLPHAELAIVDWRVCRAVLARGDIGFGATYVAGGWTSPDLLLLLDLLIANRAALEGAVYGTWWGRLADRLRHLVRRNSRAGSRRNIHAHYDIGNDFYRLWLDETMTYSSALFADGRRAAAADAAADFAALPAAQRAKYARVVDALAVGPGARVLEIGCGWGGFAAEAAGRGLQVTGLTLSTEQRTAALERLAAAGLQDSTAIVLRDYRDVAERYDGIASIEMFEAVGAAYWADYFGCIRRCLAPGGRAVVQTITIADHLYDDYRRGSDFIQQYVFPGGMLPSPTAFEAAANAAGLAVVDRHAFGQDYGRTLASWLWRFTSREPEVLRCGLDETFVRTWRFYLAYCAAAFRQENTDVMQFTLAAFDDSTDLSGGRP